MFSDFLTTHSLFLIAIVSIGAGFLNAFIGGGAMIVLPTLMLAGLPPINALACTRTMDTVSAASSAIAYRRGAIKPDRGWWKMALPMIVGSALGNAVLQRFAPDYLRLIVPILLLCSAAYFVFVPDLDDQERPARMGPYAICCAFSVLGFYSGLFGPGSGVIMVVILNRWCGYGLTRAVGISKNLFVPANLVVFLGFLIGGHIVWPVALTCCIGVIAGTQIGSHIAIKGGARIIRPVAAVTCTLLSLKLLFFS